MSIRVGDGDCAINTNLVRYQYRSNTSEQVKGNTYLRLASKSKPRKPGTTLSEVVNNKAIRIPSLRPTDAELHTTEAEKSLVGLWVGMRPPLAETFARPALKGYLKGESVLSSKELAVNVITHDPNALRVVCVASDFAHATFFALVNQGDDGLCEGIECKAPEIFYFPPFRNDSETSFREREPSWNRKIVQILQEAKRPAETWPKNYDKEKFRIPLELSKKNDIVANISTYLANPRGQSQTLQRALDMLREEGDSAIEGNEMVIQLVTDPGSIEGSDCRKLKSELEALYPGLNDMQLTERELLELCQACEKAEIWVTHSQLRPFIVAYTYTQRSRQADFADASEMAKDTLRMVNLQGGFDQRASPIVEGDNLRSLIRSVINTLEELLDHSVKQTEAVVESQGSQVVSDSLPKVFEKWGNTFDVETTKVYAAHVFRYLTYSVLPVVQGDLHKGLRQRIKLLKTLEEDLG
ncbi:hypothetical protein PTNB73_00423 [Pyrenophora teres f. teres]|nr:hypothetical protein HRS9139_01665 [Pyrenophora teres f. teres]KAE8851406.1 hypothetical protein HRS9122_01693 [Pyrenophora teres f. teres]KAE8873791.1 hypothetical protein PTNB73_00423 [Pyrenophora teres f. teres]